MRHTSGEVHIVAAGKLPSLVFTSQLPPRFSVVSFFVHPSTPTSSRTPSWAITPKSLRIGFCIPNRIRPSDLRFRKAQASEKGLLVINDWCIYMAMYALERFRCRQCPPELAHAGGKSDLVMVTQCSQPENRFSNNPKAAIAETLQYIPGFCGQPPSDDPSRNFRQG